MHAPLEIDCTFSGRTVPLKRHLPGTGHSELGGRYVATWHTARGHLKPARHHHARHGHVGACANGPDVQQLAGTGPTELDDESVSTLPKRGIRRPEDDFDVS